jgi:hypothetical protein
LTRIGVKLRKIRNLYVLVVLAPGSRTKILERREARRPWLPIHRGDVLRVTRKKVRATSFVTRIERRGDVIEHITEIFTRAIPRRRAPRLAIPANVVRMPTGDGSVVAEFLRYHVLVRVYRGDPDAWLTQLREQGGNEGDLRFVRWIRSRLRQDPSLLASIRAMVDATPFWRVAEA